MGEEFSGNLVKYFILCYWVNPGNRYVITAEKKQLFKTAFKVIQVLHLRMVKNAEA